MREILIALVAAAVVAPQPGAASGDAASAARAWLTLVDHGQYGASWASAGTIFKAHVSRSRWTRMAGQVRAPLGAVISRRPAGDEPSTSLPGVPDGNYDQIHFRAVFAHKAQAMETVVMARQKDGWRVDGYFIR